VTSMQQNLHLRPPWSEVLDFTEVQTAICIALASLRPTGMNGSSSGQGVPFSTITLTFLEIGEMGPSKELTNHARYSPLRVVPSFHSHVDSDFHSRGGAIGVAANLEFI
jgi:hypothetical protein